MVISMTLKLEEMITDNPYDIFHILMSEAKVSEPSDPDAACLATVDKDGYPNARVVLIRRIDERGFCFFTNTNSQKGMELENHPKAAINFHWKSLKRQIRIRGNIQRVSDSESDSYYASRPLGNRIGAWASLQSQILPNQDDLVMRVKEFEQKFSETPPRPEHWGGYRLTPTSFEFWQEGENRLHTRIKFERISDTEWKSCMLYP
jgi:pyridoxamine 5'-phosphate oxidase